MSDYTPTTEEVAEIYFQSGYKTTPEQFDRWLEQVQAGAWKEGYVAGFPKAMGGELDGSARAACCPVYQRRRTNDE